MSAPSHNGSAPRRLVLVVGIGRSGTSLFAGILGQLGFHVPQPEVKVDDTNPRGFSEPRWVVDFHTRLMRERRVTVFDSRPAAWESTAEAAGDPKAFEDLRSWLEVQFVGVDNVVVKDPRIGWFLPLWRRCADALGLEISYATMLRHPAEVTRSARQWYGTWQADASRLAAWLNVTLHTEEATRGERRAFVRYDRLLEDWPREISRVGSLAGVPWLVDIEPSRHPEVGAFVDPGLRRSTGGWEDVPAPEALRSMADDVWRLVSELAAPDGGDASAQTALDEARADYVSFYAATEAVAQSSLKAVAPRRMSVVGASSNGRSGGPAGSSPFRLVARVLPARQRERLAEAGGLRALPLVVALRVPPRYREKVPLPVVRAGLRMFRGRR
jgi:hypothetical protein